MRDGIGQVRVLQEQIEGIWALAWAVSLQDSIDFSVSCSDSFFLLLPNLRQQQASGEFRVRMQRRKPDEVTQVLDLAYCLHWAIRDAELAGRRYPLRVPAYAIFERRKALEWVTSDATWDELPLDT